MNTLISASAGSGKTYALTTEYLRLLRAGRDPASVLAATFTRKAAGEIFDRLLSRLAAACLDEDARADLAIALRDPTLTQDECRALLQALCGGLHRLSVGTLDGFFQRLCAVFRQEAGLSGAMRLTDPRGPRGVVLRRDALRAMLRRLPDNEVEELLDTLNKGAVASPVLAAFDGLAAELIEVLEGVPDVAWQHLKIPEPPEREAVDSALASLRVAQDSLSDKRWQKAVDEDLRRFAGARWEEFVSTGLAVKCLRGETEYYKKPIPTEMISHYAPLLALARVELLGELRRRTHAIRDVLAVFSQEYRALRRAEGLVLFSEAPGFLLPLLGDRADTARRLDAPVEHLLLDEFQDTSDPQWGILQHFAHHASEEPRSVFVVGDVKQAIYGWRGGRAEIFERIESELPGLEREQRAVSYRSSSVVLEVVNQVFASLSDCPALTDCQDARGRWQAHFQPHRAHKDLPGHIEMCESPAEADHLDHAAARISECLRQFPSGTSVGILARKNDTVARLADSLRELGIEVSSEGTGAVADDPAVEIILSALTFADHPGHSAAAFHVAHSPLAEPLGIPPDLCTRPTEAAAMASSIRRRILTQGYAGVLADWAMSLAPYGMDRTARRLEQLLDLAAGFDALPPMRPSEFVRAVRDAAVENPGAAAVRVMTINRAKGLEFDAVFLPELDWKAAGPPPTCLIQRATPSAASASPIAAVYSYPKEAVRRLDPTLEAAYAARQDEEITGMLCLLYVALTRARHALHLLVRPAGVGVTPANILRHALAAQPEPLAGSGSRLHRSGDEHWHGQDSPTEPLPMPPPNPRLSVNFKPLEGLRRRPMSVSSEPIMAGDLLRLD